jgi:hypothetical protein
VATIFLVGSVTGGAFLVPRIVQQLEKLRTDDMRIVSALLFCFEMACLANEVGLAPIVGTVAAGLLLEEVHLRKFREDVEIEHLITPISAFLVRVFFVLMSIQIRLETFAQLSILGVGTGITIATIAGKQVWRTGTRGQPAERGHRDDPTRRRRSNFRRRGKTAEGNRRFNLFRRRDHGNRNHADYSSCVEDGPCTSRRNEQVQAVFVASRMTTSPGSVGDHKRFTH